MITSSTPRQPFTFDRVVRLSLSFLAVAIVVSLVYVLRSVLLPFGVAALAAYMLEPFVQYVRRIFRLRGRTLAVLISLIATVAVISLLVSLFMPSIIGEMKQVGAMISLYVSSDKQVDFIPEWLNNFLKENIDFNHIAAMLSGADWLSIGSGAMRVVQGGFDILLSVFNWMLSLLYMVFIMIDYDRLGAGIRAMVPPRYRHRAFTVARDIKESMNHYFRGQALVAFCVGVLFCIGFLIMGLPLAVVLGLFIGLLNMVPYLQLVSIPLTGMLCLVYAVDSGASFWVIFGEAMLVYCVVQGIQDLFLTPKIMGKAMGLNPAIILLSLSVWGTLLGLLGMIIALPLTTLLLSYYERYILRKASRDTVQQVTGLPDSSGSTTDRG
ncbi:MAG: AI-2E family transporter [Muribaculaceae bacterium]|nr:AI-2E family transporter [Muribaculaceae bacterium]